MTVVMYALGVVLFVVGVAVSIGLHEVGHPVSYTHLTLPTTERV